MKIVFCNIFLLCLMLCGFSCKTHIENAETKSIDSLLSDLNKAEEKLNSIDYVKLEEAISTAKQSATVINSLPVDSLNLDKVFLMNNYAIVSGEKIIKEDTLSETNHNEEQYTQRSKFIEKEVGFCKKQLKNLKGDFESGQMDLTTFKKFYVVEKEKALKIISFIDMEKKSGTHRIAVFDSLHPLVLKFIDSLQHASSKKN